MIFEYIIVFIYSSHHQNASMMQTSWEVFQKVSEMFLCLIDVCLCIRNKPPQDYQYKIINITFYTLNIENGVFFYEFIHF